MQDPLCIHARFEVSVKLQRARELGEAQEREGGRDGEMQEVKPGSAAVGITWGLQSRGEARFCLLC